MAKQYVYLFDEGNAGMRDLLGGKGANLAEMTNLGLPVPPGFTISTEACMRYYDDGCCIDKSIMDQVDQALQTVEKNVGKKLGDKTNPFLVSVRSGARASMPGMMDTILNLGLNDETVVGIAELANPRFAYDSYRRFIQMFSDVVMEIDKTKFEAILDEIKEKYNRKSDVELTSEELQEVVARYKNLYKEIIGDEFPQDPRKQLQESIQAVFRSWNNPRAIYYRRMNDIPSDWGTAVNVQAMVFGNMGEGSGTGVAFTRNPSTGENKLFGEFLSNAQGEDVVAGIRTPDSVESLAQSDPIIYKQFLEIADKLEKHYRDMQDMEYTIENGRLYMLQTRNGKRTAQAAIHIACALVDEGMIDEKEALLRIDPKQLEFLLHATFKADAIKNAVPIAHGLPASPGAAGGKIYFTAETAVDASANGEKVILVRNETSPEDIQGMHVAEGILTARGGMTSHAAVVARGMGTCCVAGCHEITIDEAKKTMIVDNQTFMEGDSISLDGASGNVYVGELETESAKLSDEFERIMKWADNIRTLAIRTNADTPEDAKNAMEFGAEGIGLCRTEHMFFADDRIMAVREMILSHDSTAREKALAKLLPMQRHDFEMLYDVAEGHPVTIRFLDPPLHEFVPHTDAEIEALSKEMNVSVAFLKQTIDDLHEMNPMLGHRGCRLAVSFPEIPAMQTRAVIEAALNIQKKKNIKIIPEIMIPLIGEKKELDFVRNIVVKTAEEVMSERNEVLEFHVGTMIEIPRAALTADEIAQSADFFSFGTNDLTQMTFGLSRDDAGKFLNDYYERQIYESDPFARVDQKGVGKLMEIATTGGRATKSNLKIGICGEHGGDPSTIEFCYKIGLNYVSCSPYRVPIARLAAAQAVLKNQ